MSTLPSFAVSNEGNQNYEDNKEIEIDLSKFNEPIIKLIFDDSSTQFFNK